jgi:hypothetical protein
VRETPVTSAAQPVASPREPTSEGQHEEDLDAEEPTSRGRRVGLVCADVADGHAVPVAVLRAWLTAQVDGGAGADGSRAIPRRPVEEQSARAAARTPRGQVLGCVARSPALSMSMKATTFRDRCCGVGYSA